MESAGDPLWPDPCYDFYECVLGCDITQEITKGKTIDTVLLLLASRELSFRRSRSKTFRFTFSGSPVFVSFCAVAGEAARPFRGGGVARGCFRCSCTSKLKLRIT